MSAKDRPKWQTARNRPPQRCGQCGWQTPGHSPACATRYYLLKSAEAIADSRVALMLWMDVARHTLGVRTAAAAYAMALSGRARQLGLEEDQAGDFDYLPALRPIHQ